jgi:hypothetical protein
VCRGYGALPSVRIYQARVLLSVEVEVEVERNHASSNFISPPSSTTTRTRSEAVKMRINNKKIGEKRRQHEIPNIETLA